MSCQSPLAWDELLAYWLGELESEQEVRVEEHYLGCEVCSQRLAQLARLAKEVRQLTMSSRMSVIINDAFVRRLAEQGLQVREYRVPCNGSVNCTVVPEDDIVVARLEAPLKDVQRLDLVTLGDAGGGELRQEDVPFMVDDGEVVVSPAIAFLRALPKTTVRMRLLRVDDNNEQILGEYTFNHTPYSE